MNSKGIVIAIVIIMVIAIAGIYLAAQNTGLSDNTSNVSSNPPENASQQNNTTMVNNGTNSTNTTNSTNNTNDTNTTVSSKQAQKIAQAYILESGAYPGAPTLNTWSDGRLVWNVPIINSNGEKEGVSIYIDAQTGARLG